jgi:mono/diheme cytochrome c family protein
LLLTAACGGPARIAAREGAKPLVADEWFEARAQGLALSVEQTRARDQALSEEAPPSELDAFTREQAAAAWSELCAKCHGEDGDPEVAPVKNDPPPKSWGTFGTSMGFFFGGDKMRAGIYRKIADGAPSKPDGSASAMAAWSGTLAREQIWALVLHIESF